MNRSPGTVRTIDAGGKAPAPALKRYLWVQVIGKPACGSAGPSGLGIFDAPEPSGPWTTVFYNRAWDVQPGESASLPTRWMSGEGWTVHLVFSGGDSFSVRRAKLAPADPGGRAGEQR